MPAALHSSACVIPLALYSPRIRPGSCGSFSLTVEGRMPDDWPSLFARPVPPLAPFSYTAREAAGGITETGHWTTGINPS